MLLSMVVVRARDGAQTQLGDGSVLSKPGTARSGGVLSGIEAGGVDLARGGQAGTQKGRALAVWQNGGQEHGTSDMHNAAAARRAPSTCPIEPRSPKSMKKVTAPARP